MRPVQRSWRRSSSWPPTQAGVWWLGRGRIVHRPLTWFSALGSVAVAVSFTLARDGAPETFRPGDVLAWAGSGWDRLGHGDLLGSSQFLLNVALLVPAGVAWVWLTRRPGRTLLRTRRALDAHRERAGGRSELGAADIAGGVADPVGAAVSMAAGAFVSTGIDRSGGSDPSPAVGRKRAVVAVGTAVAVSPLSSC